VRRQRVLLDSDLAALYGVPTSRLNQQVRRNWKRFPADFAFQLKINELRHNLLHFATGSRKHRDPKRAPIAFTEHGVVMAANVLNSAQAVEMSVHIVRAFTFIKLRRELTTNADLTRKLEALTSSVAQLDEETRRRFDEVHAAIRALIAAPEPRKRPIGFTADLE
jgi:hypothetical protein